MIKLRLQRKGRKKRPFYHIVVADSRSPRDGRIIEKLGRYDNVSENQELVYDEERVIHWLKIGAQPSDTVRSILKHEGILYKMHLMRWGKSDEEIEAALEEWRSAREAKKSDTAVSRKAKQKDVLKAEEQEYKKQLEEKAAAAAKALEKKKEQEEAKAAEEAAAEETAEPVAEAAEEATTEPEEAPAEESTEEEVKAEEVKEEAPAEEVAEVKKEEEPAEEEVEAKKEEEPAAEEVAETKEEEPVAEEAAPVAEEETKEESPAEPEVKEEKAEAAPAQLSTDMTANEAIDHIKNTPIEELKGFVPEGEERVTVQRAWESKQED